MERDLESNRYFLIQKGHVRAYVKPESEYFEDNFTP
jgi:hypothetical protein